MAHASQHDSPDFLHHDAPADRTKIRSVSFGFGALCLLLVAAIAVLAAKLNQQNTARADLQVRFDQATAEVTAAKNDLRQANTKTAELQSQLDNTTSQVTNLQAEAKKAQEAGTGLQAQLDKARSDLRSEQEKARAQVAELQAQTEQAKTASAALQKEFNAARTENQSLKSQLEQAKAEAAKAQPVAAPVPARPLPLTSEFKKSFFGTTFTLHLKNTGTDPLKVNLGITGSDKTPSTSATIEGGKTFKLEGLTAGAKIEVASEGFQPVSLTAM